jgi:hypothetical protein
MLLPLSVRQVSPAIVSMFAADGLSAPTFEVAIAASDLGGCTEAATAHRVHLQEESRQALRDLQAARPQAGVTSSMLERQGLARLLAPARVLQTQGVPLVPASSAGSGSPSGVRLAAPDFVLSLHAGKPPDLFAFKPWPNEPGVRGDCESKAAAVVAARITLPSPFAVLQLAKWAEGRALLNALTSRLTSAERTGGVARPSRFALVSASLQRDSERARLASLPVMRLALEGADSMVSAAAYDEHGLWLLGITVGPPHEENTIMVGVFSGQYGQMAVCSPHALTPVWRHHPITHAKAAAGDTLWCVDGAALAHPLLNVGSFTNRQQELIYSRYADVLRLLVDNLDTRTTIYIADVTGKRPIHQAAYAARLVNEIDVGKAEERASFALRHAPAVVKAVGRTVTGYKTSRPGEETVETVENRETLHSLLVDALAGQAGLLLTCFMA